MFKVSKLVKTIILIPLIAIVLILAVLLIAPALFKDQIMTIAKTELNKMLNAKVDFKDLKLSFIKNFPSAYIGLDGLEVTGVDDFEGELLAAFDRFSVTVNLMSVIKMDNIEVKSILLDRARLNGIILEDGLANWNIMKDSGNKDEAVVTETKSMVSSAEPSDPFKFKVSLSKFEIRNLEAAFRDDSSKMQAGIQSLNFILRGDMRKENVDLNLKLNIDGIDFWMGTVRFANKASVGFVSQIAADLKNMRFALKDNKFNLNEIILKLNGTAEINGSDITTDITFATEKTDFKSLLSLVPAIYMTDFKDLKTAGTLTLSGDVKGTLTEGKTPSANVKLNVDNAMFSYPAVPKSVNKINIAVRAHYDGEVFDRTTADVDRFSFEIASNPFLAEVHVKTPESDLDVSAKFNGKIDIDSVSDIIPIDDTTLNGLLECDVSLAGKMSTLQKERYEDFNAAGFIKLSKFNFLSPVFPQGAKISSLLLNFTPRRVELANLDVITGSSDISLSGSLENFIPFVLKKETVRGNLSLKSNNINLNEIMGEKEEEEKKDKPPAEEPSQMSVIEVPKNIDFAVNVNIGNILFDKLTITNTKGAITVKDGKLTMNNLALNLLEGSMILKGEYNTQNIAIPFIDFDMNINQFNITSALSSFAFLEKILPQPQNYSGKVSAVMTFYSVLDPHMSPVLDSINSKGRLKTYNLQIRNSKIFGALSDLTKNESYRTPSPDNFDIGFEIKSGRLYLQDPIKFNMPPTKIEIAGDQGLDMTLNYRINASMPASIIGAAELLSKIPGGSNIKEIKLTGVIKGTATDPDVSLSMADMTSSVKEAAKDQIKTAVSDEVNKQIDQIMKEANNQADNIRSAAKTAANKLRNEADASANKLVSNAGSNPVQKKLAEEGAKKLRSEGEASAKKLENEADAQAKAVIAAAQKKADALKK